MHTHTHTQNDRVNSKVKGFINSKSLNKVYTFLGFFYKHIYIYSAPRRDKVTVFYITT